MTRREPPELLVAVGEEGSDPVVTHGGRDHRVDEFAASGHLERMETDLADVAGLGVRVLRHGMPWRCTEPEPGVHDWTLWDRMLAACAAHGLEPIVDLLHFGLPDHYRGFADAGFVDGFGRYVDAFELARTVRMETTSEDVRSRARALVRNCRRELGERSSREP